MMAMIEGKNFLLDFHPSLVRVPLTCIFFLKTHVERLSECTRVARGWKKIKVNVHKNRHWGAIVFGP